MIWLSVPLAAYHFASQNYEKYLEAEQRQLRALSAQESYLRVHTSALTAKSAEIRGLNVQSQRMQWKREWQALVDDREHERALLSAGETTHYPLTQQRLTELDQKLDDLQKQVERADNYHYDAIRLRSSIEQLVAQIDAARANAYYFERIRAWGIHDLLLDDIGQMEDTYNQRWRDLRRAEQVSASKLGEAERTSREILRVINDIDSLKQADSQEAYQSDLSRRLDEFNLVRELRKLATGDDAEAAPGLSGVV